MALDPRKRQKKAERRKAKDKAKAIAERKHARTASTRILMSAEKAPFVDCFVTDAIWEHGIGQLVVSRRMPDGSIAFVNFVVDAYLLGVKNVLFNIVSPAEFKSRILEPIRERNALVNLKPACARKLVEGAVDYAKSFELFPHSDYRKAQVIFGDVDPNECTEQFEYGKDGKPYYFAGPHDSYEKSMAIVNLLRNQVGEDGFHFVLPMEG